MRMRTVLLGLLLAIAMPTLNLKARDLAEFGVKGDGQGDDTAALQKALDSGNGPVELPYGSYRLTAPLVIPSGGGLVGRGTLLMDADTETLVTAGYRDDAPTTTTDIVIDGITIRKTFVENSQANGIFIAHARNVRIRGVELTGLSARMGVRLENVEAFSVTDCYIHDFHHAMMEPKMPNGENVDGFGIGVMRCSMGTIAGNRIENIEQSVESARKLAYQTDGINLSQSRSVTVAYNTVRNVGEGIDTIGSKNIAITGNTFEHCYHFGIKIIHGTSLISVTGNSIRDTGLAGMSLYFGHPRFGEVFGLTVVGNTIANPGAIGIPDEGTEYRHWSTWEHAGIEIVNDNRPDNDVRDLLVANNTIYDDQAQPTMKFGILERHVEYAGDTNWYDPVSGKELYRRFTRDEITFHTEPPADPELRRNLLHGNLIRGATVEAVRAGSKVVE